MKIKMFYFFVKKKNLSRLVWTVLAFFSSYNLRYRTRIISVPWQVVLFLSRLDELPIFYHLHFQCGYMSLRFPLMRSFWQCHYLWESFILFITAIFFIFIDKSPSLCSSGCISGVSQMVAASTFPQSSVSYINSICVWLESCKVICTMW